MSFQKQVNEALEALKGFNPDLESQVREAMPAFATEDLTDPEAAAVLAWLEEEGLL